MVINGWDYLEEGGRINVQRVLDRAGDGDCVVLATAALKDAPQGGWIVRGRFELLLGDPEGLTRRFVFSGEEKRWDPAQARSSASAGDDPC